MERKPQTIYNNNKSNNDNNNSTKIYRKFYSNQDINLFSPSPKKIKTQTKPMRQINKLLYSNFDYFNFIVHL